MRKEHGRNNSKIISFMKVYVYTLGCRVNQCESEAIAQAFVRNGHNVVQSHESADLIIVNTCTVTSKAEQKARRVIRIFASCAVTLVTGCYAQVNPSEIQSLSENVVVLPLIRKAELLRLPEYLVSSDEPLLTQVKKFAFDKKYEASVFDYAATGFSYHCRSYLKIQDGCDNNCGFCLTHIARGKSSFLDSETVIRRALEIEANGYHEIVLTGVNLDMYNHDGAGLGGLLEKMLPKLGSQMRIRLSSLEPDHVDDRLVEVLSDFRMQPYFHIPVQSAADKVIARVNRHYNSAHLEHVISKIRTVKDDPFLSCDVITGLPGEGEQEFAITYDFLKEHGFSLMHVFPFSPRPYTALYKAKDKVPESIRDERAKILRELSDSQNREYVMRQIGKNNEVILEERKGGIWYGLTGNYMRVSVDKVPENSDFGDLLKVRITEPQRSVAL